MESTTATEEAPPDGPLNCSACMGSTEPSYLAYNLMVSGVILAIVGLVGLCGNVLVVRVYLSKQLRIHSCSIYLACLAMSDFCLIVTAMFLFVLEAWRHHDNELAAWLYVTGAPAVFPLAAVFQTSSVYFCVAAAVDCFICVVLPSVKHLYCTPKRAKITVYCIMVFCFCYNVPHMFEIEKVTCIDDGTGLNSTQICPTEFRVDPTYYHIYYSWMYTVFLAVGPLLLLVLLNICVVYTVVRTPAEEGEESDTVSLILVVFFFIFCNATALFVNFLELIFGDEIRDLIVYLVDMSNLLVVINGTMNFFCYLIFGAQFRRTLLEIINPRRNAIKVRVDNGQWLNGESKLDHIRVPLTDGENFDDLA